MMYAPTRTFCSCGIDQTYSLNFACSEWLHQLRWQLEFDFFFTARHRRDIDGPQCAQRIDYVLDHFFGCRRAAFDADCARAADPCGLHFGAVRDEVARHAAFAADLAQPVRIRAV